MEIIQYILNEDTNGLYIEFNFKTDSDDEYRILEVEYEDIEFYTPTVINNLTEEISEEFVIEFMKEYFEENEVPELLSL
jgi:hypothetical protein